MGELVRLFSDFIKSGRHWHLGLLLLIPASFEFFRNYDESLTFRTTLSDERFLFSTACVVVVTALLHVFITYRHRLRLSLFWMRPLFRRRGEVEWIAVSNSIAWYPLRWVGPSGKLMERPLAQELAVTLSDYPFRVVVVPQKLIEGAEFAEEYYADACVVKGRIEGQAVELKAQMILSEDRVNKIFGQLRSKQLHLDLDELVLPIASFIDDPFFASNFRVSVALRQSNAKHQAAVARLVLRQAAATALFYRDDPRAGLLFGSVIDGIRLEDLPKIENHEIARILFQVGYYFMTHKQDSAKAMSALETATHYAPENVDIRRAMAILSMAEGESDRVEEHLAAINTDPLTGLIRAANHCRFKRIEEAIEEYEKVSRSNLATAVSEEEIERFYSLLLLRIGLTYGASDRPRGEVAARIIQYSEDIIRIQPDMIAGYLLQGYAWALRGNEEKSNARFVKARALAENEGDHHLCEYWEARAQSDLGDLDGAANRLKDLLGGDNWAESDDANALVRLAQILNRTDNGAVEASLAAGRAIEIEPDNGAAHLQRGIALYMQLVGLDITSVEGSKLCSEARDSFFNTMRLESSRENKVRAAILLGSLYQQDGDLVNAVRYYEDACEIEPAADNWLLLAGTLMRSGNVDRALEKLEAAMLHCKDDPKIHLMEGVAWQRKDDLARAKQAYERTLAIDENFGDGNVNLAFVLFEEGDYQGALQHFDRAVAADGDSADCLAGRAIVLRAMGREGDAADSLSRALDKDPRFSDLDVLRSEYMWSDNACEALKPILSG